MDKLKSESVFELAGMTKISILTHSFCQIFNLEQEYLLQQIDEKNENSLTLNAVSIKICNEQGELSLHLKENPKKISKSKKSDMKF